MYDRPNAEELIDAAVMHFQKNIIPVVKNDPKLYFQTLVAINVLTIARRDIIERAGHLQAEWQRLQELLGITDEIPATAAEFEVKVADYNRRLCEEIRAGAYDMAPQNRSLFQHLMQTVREQLTVDNPKYLVLVDQEDATGSKS